MFELFTSVKSFFENLYTEIMNERSKSKQYAFTDSRSIINIVIFNEMITFTVDLTKPEAYVRVLKRKLESVVKKYGFSGKYPYRVMYDSDRNIITILLDRSYQYNLERELELLNVIYNTLPDDIEGYLRDVFTRVGSRLPNSPIGLVDVFRRVPRHFEITFDDGKQLSIDLDLDVDRAHAYGYLSALFHADHINETIVGDISYFNIPSYYHDWFVEYGNDIQGIVIGETPHTGKVDISHNHREEFTLNITACTVGIFRYAENVKVPQVG